MKAAGSVALSVAALTLASRALGFGRSVVFSKTVGDTCLGDAYNAANLLPNVLFEIVAGGVLAGVVVPVVARHVAARRTADTSTTTSALLTWTLLVLTPAALVAWAAANRYGVTFGERSCPGGAATVAALLVMFVPQIWLYGLAVVSAGILQAHSRFLAATAGPLLSSGVVISTYLVYAWLAPAPASADLSEVSTTALRTLGWGTSLGVAALALTTLLPLRRLGLRLRPRLRFAAGDVAVIVRIAAAGVAGLVMQQLSLLLISWVAKQSQDPGALTRFSWANAIYLLPYAVLVAPLLQLVFPRLTAAADQGSGAVGSVLSGVAPVVMVLACLGGALLVATAVPVARVFVLGPGSGRTDALAWPIAALGPAVVGFAVLGLGSRALLAQHLARSAGLATVVGWGVVIVSVLVLRTVVPADWVVTSLGAAVSIGMLTGGITAWSLVRASSAVGEATLQLSSGLGRSLVVAGPAALVAGVGVGWLSTGLKGVGIVAAAGGALGCAAACTGVFVLLVLLVDRNLLRRVWELRRSPGVAEPATMPAGGESP